MKRAYPEMGSATSWRYRARSTGLRRGERVMPGIRPRLAIGRPSISLMSPVKSIVGLFWLARVMEREQVR